jgi:predicted nucleotidyltransferase
MDQNKKFGLSEWDTEAILTLLRKHPKITGVILFGSRAKGDFSPGSDIDLALQGKDLCVQDILDLHVEIDELYLPYKFDLLIYEQIKNKALLEHIRRIGKVLYDATGALVH